MDELITRLVAEYKADAITWHDIQDQVTAYIMLHDGKGMSFETDVIKDRFNKANEILEKIESKLRG